MLNLDKSLGVYIFHKVVIKIENKIQSSKNLHREKERSRSSSASWQNKKNSAAVLVKGQNPFAACLGFMILTENTWVMSHSYLPEGREKMRQRVNLTLKSWNILQNVFLSSLLLELFNQRPDNCRARNLSGEL